MKTIIYRFLVTFFISFWIHNVQAQDPNWSVNTSDYQYSMTFTSFLNVDGSTLTAATDKVAAFVDGKVRGVSNVVYVASANKYVTYLSVYANTDNETINFKVYNSTSDAVVNIDKTTKFTIDENIGGIFQSYSIASPELNENAVFNSFNFLGITAVVEDISSGKINIVLPENTTITSLTAVFNSSTNSRVFVDDVLQVSGSFAHNFTNTMVYKVLSENEAVLTMYEVSVSLALNNNPITVSISTSENSNTNSIPVSLDITFSKEVSGFDISDFVLENALLSSFSTSDSQNYTVDIIPLSQGEFSVQIPASISLDLNNNPNEISNKIVFTYDISKPIISTISIDSDVSSWWFLVAFSEEVLNVTIADFDLKGMASNGLLISNIAKVSGNQYKVAVSNSNTDIGAISLQLKNDSDIKDIAGNSIVLSEFEAYFLDNEVLSTEDISILNNFSMYPNPTTNFVKIRLEEGVLKQILLYSLNGKNVFEKKSNQQESVIDIHQLNTGIYIVKIISNKGSFTKKLIKI
jgi:hypothetical protein